MCYWSSNVTDRQTDGQTTCNCNTTLCTIVHHVVKIYTTNNIKNKKKKENTTLHYSNCKLPVADLEGGWAGSDHPFVWRTDAVTELLISDNCTVCMLARILKMIATSGFLAALECTKFVFGQGSAPDLTVGAYSAPTDPLVGLRKPTSEGQERKGERKRKGGDGPPYTNSWIRPWLQIYWLSQMTT